MKKIEKIIVRDEQTKIRNLHQAFTLLFFLAEVVDLVWNHKSQYVMKAAIIVFLLIVFRFYLKTVKRQLYSFWTFALFIGAYCSYKCVHTLFFAEYSFFALFYFLAGLTLAFECYFFSSPIFFPRVRWWEYDFRYRADLPISVISQGVPLKGRLADLRRGSGCIVLFEEISLGNEVFVDLQNEMDGPGENRRLRAQLISKREFTPGRGFNYGVRFIFGTLDEKKKFKTLTKIWKKYNRKKFKSRFKNQKELA